MGTIVDTTFFVSLERAKQSREMARSGISIGERLLEVLGADDEAAIAAISASELLHGVHRASAEHHARREAFVETILSAIPVVAFDLLAARAHARLWSDLAAQGRDVGSHDRLVAATAISIGWRVATANVRHFERIRGLEVLGIR